MNAGRPLLCVGACSIVYVDHVDTNIRETNRMGCFLSTNVVERDSDTESTAVSRLVESIVGDYAVLFHVNLKVRLPFL